MLDKNSKQFPTRSPPSQAHKRHPVGLISLRWTTTNLTSVPLSAHLEATLLIMWIKSGRWGGQLLWEISRNGKRRRMVQNLGQTVYTHFQLYVLSQSARKRNSKTKSHSRRHTWQCEWSFFLLRFLPLLLYSPPMTFIVLWELRSSSYIWSVEKRFEAHPPPQECHTSASILVQV